MEGETARLHLKEDEARTWASRLHADVEMLPPTLCRNCAARFLGGELATDEYRTIPDGIYGYGFSWEGINPAAHLVVTVQHQQKAVHAFLLGQNHSQVPTNWALARLVRAWLAAEPAILAAHPFTPAQIRTVTQERRAGASAPGTEHWVWDGGIFEAWCPPLGGAAAIVVSQAGPPGQRFVLSSALAEWRELIQQVDRRAKQLFSEGENAP